MKSKKRLLFDRRLAKPRESGQREDETEAKEEGELIDWKDSFGFKLESQDKVAIDSEVSRIRKMMVFQEDDYEFQAHDCIEIETIDLDIDHLVVKDERRTLTPEKTVELEQPVKDEAPLQVLNPEPVTLPAKDTHPEIHLPIEEPLDLPTLISPSPRPPSPVNPPSPQSSDLQEQSQVSNSPQPLKLIDHEAIATSTLSVLRGQIDDQLIAVDVITSELKIEDQARTNDAELVLMALLTGDTSISHIQSSINMPSIVDSLTKPWSTVMMTAYKPKNPDFCDTGNDKTVMLRMKEIRRENCAARYDALECLSVDLIARCLVNDSCESDDCETMAIYLRRWPHVIACKEVSQTIVNAVKTGGCEVFLEVSTAWERLKKLGSGKKELEVATHTWIECALEYLTLYSSRKDHELEETIIKLISHNTYQLPQNVSTQIASKFRIIRETYLNKTQPQVDSQAPSYFNTFINRFVKN